MTDPVPAAAGIPAGHFPGPTVEAGHVEPCPRRIRARDDEGWVLDTTEAFHVWEHAYYPQYAVPLSALAQRVHQHGRPVPDDPRLAGYTVLHLDAVPEWYEESERVHGHPRNPYVRVDALRSDRPVTVRLPSGALVATCADPVAVFETGLPPRWYLDPTGVDFSLLSPTGTVTRCPYKGLADAWWAADGLGDVAWSYSAPTVALSAVAGLVAFDDTLVRVEVAERPAPGHAHRHRPGGG